MSYYVLWIDHDHAKIFNFSPAGEKVTHMNNTHHMNHHQDHQDQEKAEQQKKFYKEVEEKLGGAGGILVVGPNMAKKEFKNYLETHQDLSLAKAIVGMENLDKISDNQIRDFAKTYFHRYNLFN
ncbi:MAG: eRF1 domain 2 [Pseudobdellovibrionaceae bacterium]